MSAEAAAVASEQNNQKKWVSQLKFCSNNNNNNNNSNVITLSLTQIFSLLLLSIDSARMEATETE